MRSPLRELALLAASVVSAASLAACLDDGVGTRAALAPSSAGQVVVEVAPLELAEVTRAIYTLTVQSASGQVLAAVTLDSADYGDGRGAASYVLPCDADPAAQPNLVTATLAQLFAGDAPLAVVTPPPAIRSVTCDPDRDVPLSVDFKVVRDAGQGGLDLYATLDAIACAAQLDCVEGFGGWPGTTVILGFACATGAPGEAATHLYMSDVLVTCDGTGASLTLNPDADGHLPPSHLSGDPTLVIGPRAYRGEYGYPDVDARYWNLSFGLTSWGAASSCRVRARATATDYAYPLGAGQPPAYAIPDRYPVVAWDVALGDGGVLACSSHPLGAGNGVEVVFPPGGLELPHVFGASP